MFLQDKKLRTNLAQLPREGLICELPILLEHVVSHVGDRVGTIAAIPTGGHFNDHYPYFDLSRLRIWAASLPCAEIASIAMTASATSIACAVCLS